MKKALVCGAGGFIGSHMVKRLKSEGYWVRGVDLKYPEFSATEADDFVVGDLRNPLLVSMVVDYEIDALYQFAADMGNLNIAHEAVVKRVKKVFYSSSACIYPEHNQLDPDNPNCVESSAYPADPDSEYGWEKLFSERLYLSFLRNHGLNVRIARYHNIFGPEGTWQGGREKAPAAICRKVAAAAPDASVEVWGDGKQTRSFLYIDECIEATRRLMESEFVGPVNIGSEEMISINDLVRMVMGFEKKPLVIENIPGPEGVRGRNSNNNLYRDEVGWEVSQPLSVGMRKTYDWILGELRKQENE